MSDRAGGSARLHCLYSIKGSVFTSLHEQYSPRRIDARESTLDMISRSVSPPEGSYRTTFSSLPPEILEHVFLRLTLDERLKLMRVSQDLLYRRGLCGQITDTTALVMSNAERGIHILGVTPIRSDTADHRLSRRTVPGSSLHTAIPVKWIRKPHRFRGRVNVRPSTVYV